MPTFLWPADCRDFSWRHDTARCILHFEFLLVTVVCSQHFEHFIDEAISPQGFHTRTSSNLFFPFIQILFKLGCLNRKPTLLLLNRICKSNLCHIEKRHWISIKSEMFIIGKVELIVCVSKVSLPRSKADAARGTRKLPEARKHRRCRPQTKPQMVQQIMGDVDISRCHVEAHYTQMRIDFLPATLYYTRCDKLWAVSVWQSFGTSQISLVCILRSERIRLFPELSSCRHDNGKAERIAFTLQSDNNTAHKLRHTALASI